MPLNKRRDEAVARRVFSGQISGWKPPEGCDMTLVLDRFSGLDRRPLLIALLLAAVALGWIASTFSAPSAANRRS
jgi:hypothetical protein